MLEVDNTNAGDADADGGAAQVQTQGCLEPTKDSACRMGGPTTVQRQL